MKIKREVKVGNRFIGDNHPVFVIAEIGINHNGSLDIAKRMIDGAKRAGCDAVFANTFVCDKPAALSV